MSNGLKIGLAVGIPVLVIFAVIIVYRKMKKGDESNPNGGNVGVGNVVSKYLPPTATHTNISPISVINMRPTNPTNTGTNPTATPTATHSILTAEITPNNPTKNITGNNLLMTTSPVLAGRGKGVSVVLANAGRG